MSSFVPAKVWTPAFRRSSKTRPPATTIHPSVAAPDLRLPERIASEFTYLFLTLCPVALPLTARGQQSQIQVAGFLITASPASLASFVAAVRQGRKQTFWNHRNRFSCLATCTEPISS